MSPFFRDYFYFNRSERKGIISLVFVIFLLMVAKELFYLHAAQPKEQSQRLDSLTALIDQKIRIRDSMELAKKSSSSLSVLKDSVEFFAFDPNELPIEKWQKLGLSKKQAEVIKRYEAAGGSFTTKKDVKKMYVVSDQFYEQIKDYLLLPDSMDYTDAGAVNHPLLKKGYVKESLIIVDINTADTSDLQKLKGIGTVLSNRIVSYRNKLGGFYSKKQLQEVYGLQVEVLQQLDKQLKISRLEPRRLNINKASIEELQEHPYIQWKVANSIVKYRKQHGEYEKIEDIQNLVLINDSLFQKLKPYIQK